MEETNSKKGGPPIWWTKVINDLEKAVMASKRSFIEPNVVIKNEMNNDGETIAYLIRLGNGDIGYYPAEKFPKRVPVGSRIKSKLPTPAKIVQEPDIASYTYETLRDNVRLIPRMWLMKVLQKIHQGQAITQKDDMQSFKDWVLVARPRKKDKRLIFLLSQVTAYEGLKGLARYNDLAI